VAFYDGVTASVNKGRATVVTYLDFCKAFDAVRLKILVNKLERYGFDRLAVRWMRDWLDGHVQRATINDSVSKWKTVTSSVPQRFILGPMLFTIFSNGIESGIECTLRKFAGDIKLSGEVQTLEGSDAIQRDLGNWAHANLVKDIHDHGRASE